MTKQGVGRQRERELVRAALASGAHILLEGPPGTGKSTLLRQIAAARHTEFVLVEGSAELTPARLIGSFDPALVLEQGYRPENFSDGPLVRAMRDGGLLYVEELNRVPEETINVLLTVMSEGEINVPRLGRIAADPSFRLGAGTTPPPRSGAPARGALDYARLLPELADLRAVPADDWRAGLDAALTTLSGRVRRHESCRRSADQVIEEIFRAVRAALPDDSGGGDARRGE